MGKVLLGCDVVLHTPPTACFSCCQSLTRWAVGSRWPAVLYFTNLLFWDVKSLPLEQHLYVIKTERASSWELISTPRIHLLDSTGFSCHHSHVSLSPCSQDSCLPSQTLATDLLSLGKAFGPPTKRHCYSSSGADDCLYWKPLGSKAWMTTKHWGSSEKSTLEEQHLIPDHGACSFRFDQRPRCISLQHVQGCDGSSSPFLCLVLSQESPISRLWENEKTL
nr:uncharacterized protein LOC102457870 isoform X2 [Pelodiscus sinensis]|eukprot:XP_006121700.1 uncharacterized protein LOC102457870 isoform X2 [Pelodiscus sinensis]